MDASPKLSGAEHIKSGSQRLRGRIGEELAAGAAPGGAAPGGVSEETYTLLKFHGTYEQYDRDTATPRKQAGLDKEWGFMVRVRCPAGRLTAAQWLVLDELADRHGDGTLRLTTRQGVQFHGVARGAVKPLIAAINHALMTTLAACGDVVRNVVTSPAPRHDAVQARLEAEAIRLSSALLPRSRAHHQIFLDEESAAGSAPEEEPLYGPTYLPRKFKIGLAHPGDNTPDLLTHDLGFLAVVEGGEVTGWIVTVGGGMGMTHNKPATYPRLADPIARIGRDEVLEVAEAVVRLARDHGDRADRKHARLKYVVAERGVAWVRERLSADLGRPLEAPGPLPPLAVPELLGWHPQGDGRWWLGLPIPAGRIAGGLRQVLREAIRRFGADPVATPQQDLLLTNIATADRAALEALLREGGVVLAEDLTPLARWALACVALPTCGQALAEGERVRGQVVADLERVLARHGLAGERLSLRITGCPNGCARPYGGEIGVVGRAPGLYVLYLGGDFEGTRLSFPVADKVRLAEVAETLEPALAAWARQRGAGEGFGDFCLRLGQAPLQALLRGVPA
ncbi:NADPH-dependent assimilatory sulfite reductase hemoprotein subunit [Roseomonas sp. GC11]|uniref:NADPH-dependent assimilatory sulfite reductase hemoprotein subunit n=1 Tax=Roseomonas sp. GC11 TaxID=2950546 RepID=UPI00210B5C56|nr:NADPH-dependent assimilatory sulfite reductase hemoprotein subunit [Roseomonas sp. GC11]MCQ4159475.1 NADPH-dependent assimilatory sulfite reductase hemoprotein subunit [Roseomonas sp. GC11]